MKKILSKCVCLVSWVMIESSILKELYVKCHFRCHGVEFVFCFIGFVVSLYIFVDLCCVMNCIE